MGGYYDEIEIEDMTYDSSLRIYHYPCPCGDRFEISRAQLAECEDIATCPSCSLVIRIIFDPLDFEDDLPEEDDEEEEESSQSTGSDLDDEDQATAITVALKSLDISSPTGVKIRSEEDRGETRVELGRSSDGAGDGDGHGARKINVEDGGTTFGKAGLPLSLAHSDILNAAPPPL